MSRPPTYWDDQLAVARLALSIDAAVPWPETLAAESDAWQNDATQPQQCRHIGTEPMMAYGMIFQPRVLVCPPCLVEWEDNFPLPVPCAVCDHPGARYVLDGGRIGIVAYLCPFHQPTGGDPNE